MSEVQLIRYLLKDRETERMYEWMDKINSRREEAIETLQNENVLSEAAFLESRADGDYVSFYMEAEDLEAATEAFEESTHSIDQEFKELLSEVVAQEQPEEDIELLYHLANPNRS